MNEWIDEFLIYLKIERELAPGTISSYKGTLRMLQQFLTHRKNITAWQDVTYEDLRDFVYYLAEERQNSPSARASKISNIKGFFHFIQLEGVIDHPVAERLIKPKIVRNLPVYLTVDECRRFIAIIKENSAHALRDTTVILTFIYTGVRMSELHGLNVDDINLEQDNMKVTGKGRKERLIPLNKHFKEHLIRYMEERKIWLGLLHADVRPLFVDERKTGGFKRLSRTKIQDIFKRYAKQANIHKEPFSAHKLRHTFATLLYNSGVDLVELQQLLGHAHLTTTQIYTHTSVEQLREAVNKNPLDIMEERLSYLAQKT